MQNFKLVVSLILWQFHHVLCGERHGLHETIIASLVTWLFISSLSKRLLIQLNFLAGIDYYQV